MSSSRQSSYRVVAIDGPAASGKSSVARELAQRLGFAYVNSGAIYRAITWHILRKAIDPGDSDRVAQSAESANITCCLRDNESRIFIDNIDPTDYLREDRVNKSVSRVSSVPRVRQIVVQRLRDYARSHDLVVEGRDIGSVVFPGTPYKFYVDASPDVRLRRRVAQGQRDEIVMRDHADSSRLVSPLVVAKDAHVIDTSHLTIEGVVSEIVARLKQTDLKVSARLHRFSASPMNVYYWLGYHFSRLVGRLCFHLRVIHRERMIQSGPVILAMNHQSYLDPPLAGITCDRAIYFLARRTLMEVPLLSRLLPKLNVIPVNQEGVDRSALKALIRVLKAGNAALVFPEGSRTLDGNLQPAEPGLGLVIAKTLAPVVPMRIFGAHEALPRGGGGLHFMPITIVIGEPIFFTSADVKSREKNLYRRLSQRVMDAIAALELK